MHSHEKEKKETLQGLRKNMQSKMIFKDNIDHLSTDVRLNNRDFKIPGRLTERTVILGAEDWAETDVLGGKLFTLRSGLCERRTAANLKFLALFVNHGIF